MTHPLDYDLFVLMREILNPLTCVGSIIFKTKMDGVWHIFARWDLTVHVHIFDIIFFRVLYNRQAPPFYLLIFAQKRACFHNEGHHLKYVAHQSWRSSVWRTDASLQMGNFACQRKPLPYLYKMMTKDWGCDPSVNDQPPLNHAAVDRVTGQSNCPVRYTCQSICQVRSVERASRMVLCSISCT